LNTLSDLAEKEKYVAFRRKVEDRKERMAEIEESVHHTTASQQVA